MAKDETKTITDAHGNKQEVPARVGTGPAHLAEKHPEGVNTGKKDAHGNDIWETPKKRKEAEAS